MRSVYPGMRRLQQTAHGDCDAPPTERPARPEPEFDADRVIWDADYRRDVIERLRQWHLHHDERARSAATGMKAA